jgi:DNA polymerase elongation subunit (family B)
VGFHTDVAEFDFVSLYPNIMNRHNLSPETLFCPCCRENKVPGLHYHYCTKTRGIVPIVAKKLIERRMELKKEKTPQAKEKRDALKWLLVTMFGYQACVHRKIGIIETHESIQAYARETILEAVRTAEHHDFEVIHGIIDSLYVKKRNFTEKDAQRLGKEIFFNTDLEISCEGRYKWIVFLPSIIEPAMPIANRFYGVFENGEIKVRGIEARRKDVPSIVAKMQMEMIEKLAEAKNEEEFCACFPRLYAILKNYVRTLDLARVEDLAIVRTLSKTDYKSDIAQRIVVKQMQADGYQIEPGMTISYVLRDTQNQNPRRRYSHVQRFDGTFDKEKYIELMVKAVYGMLLPFGVTIADAYKEIEGERQMAITDYQEMENMIRREFYSPRIILNP